jgi:hypothetical protein
MREKFHSQRGVWVACAEHMKPNIKDCNAGIGVQVTKEMQKIPSASGSDSCN